MARQKKDIPLPKKNLERMTKRASLLYAEMRARANWETFSWKKKKECFGAMLNIVLREHAISDNEWALYKSILGVWLQKRSAARRKFQKSLEEYYAEL